METRRLTDIVDMIDSDTHVAEPPDLWTSRVAEKWRDRVPHVIWDDESEREMWVAGDRVIGPPGIFALAGHDEYPPDCPARMADTDPSIWDNKARLARMDRDGVQAQVLYANVALFDPTAFLELDEMALKGECIRVYNDWQTEFASIAPDRFLPMTVLPFWDVKECIKELERGREMGHRGVAFSQDPARYGAPPLASPHWYPLWQVAQDAKSSINFHVAAVGTEGAIVGADHGQGRHANYAEGGAAFKFSNARAIAALIFGGVCHRFPELNFVSVESGAGWIPTALAMMDWSWANGGVHAEHPEYDLLPTEYFKRQIYGTFWFERETAVHAFDVLGDDNFFFESDFPHPTCLAPGPKTLAKAPKDWLEDGLAHMVPETTLRKVLHDNAARVYHLD